METVFSATTFPLGPSPSDGQEAFKQKSRTRIWECEPPPGTICMKVVIIRRDLRGHADGQRQWFGHNEQSFAVSEHAILG